MLRFLVKVKLKRAGTGRGCVMLASFLQQNKAVRGNYLWCITCAVGASLINKRDDANSYSARKLMEKENIYD